MTCHLLKHFMLVSPGGILVIKLSRLLLKISFERNVLDGTFQEDRLLFPRVTFVGFFNLSDLFSAHWLKMIKYQISTEATCSNVFLLAFLLTYSSNSSGFAFSSRDISAYWASSPATKNCSRLFKIFLPHRQRSQI